MEANLDTLRDLVSDVKSWYIQNTEYVYGELVTFSNTIKNNYSYDAIYLINIRSSELNDENLSNIFKFILDTY